MTKQRTLSESFWDDPDTAYLSRDERLLFAGMITLLADDEGRLIADARYLRKRIFGYDEDVTVEDVARWRNNIASKCHNVKFYCRNDQEYIWLANFQRYQNIRYVVASKLPPFTEESSTPPPGGAISRNFPQISENSGSRDARAVGVEESRVKDESGWVEVEEDESLNPRAREASEAEPDPPPAPPLPPPPPPPPGQNYPEGVRARIALQGKIEACAADLKGRRLTKAEIGAINRWASSHLSRASPDIVEGAAQETAEHTNGEGLAYFFKVMERMIYHPGQNQPVGKGGNSNNGGQTRKQGNGADQPGGPRPLAFPKVAGPTDAIRRRLEKIRSAAEHDDS